jgi:hypothetical protein
MTLNSPLILLSIVRFSIGQAIALAATSIFAQCRFKVLKKRNYYGILAAPHELPFEMIDFR